MENRVPKGYPRPQFERKDWVSLNGEWTCKIKRRPPYCKGQDETANFSSKGFSQKIMVPFAPETKLSGVGEDEIITRIFYHREIEIPSSWMEKRILLHFGAVFYSSEIWIDGKFCDFHDGGSSSFTVDITDQVVPGGKHDLVVKADSDLQSGNIPSGKQSSFMKSYKCYYQRTTGIWQTVWMEAVSPYALKSVRTMWNASSSTLSIAPEYWALRKGAVLETRVAFKGEPVAVCRSSQEQGVPVSIQIPEPKLWEPGEPNLYDIEYTLYDGSEAIDSVSSYTGLRTVSVIDNDFYLNGKKLYQRLVLDQGFYPESNWTSPSDEALENDIRLSMKAGFNGARLHQKVFEERFFYLADKLGYIVWAESPSWGLDYNNESLPARNFLSEWGEIVRRDVNHPSIICWTPLNETYYFTDAHAHRRLHRDAYDICKEIDPTRPVNDASGYIHYVTDVWTVHSYMQDPAKFSDLMALKDGKPYRNYPEHESEYSGQPYIVDEYGGIKWDPETQKDMALAGSQNLESWGYGQAPRTLEEYYRRLEDLTDVLLSKEHISGYCFTQLTDVEQEKNGIYFYTRGEKFDMERIARIFRKKPEGYDL